jgi:hypothetical protein
MMFNNTTKGKHRYDNNKRIWHVGNGILPLFNTVIDHAFKHRDHLIQQHHILCLLQSASAGWQGNFASILNLLRVVQIAQH